MEQNNYFNQSNIQSYYTSDGALHSGSPASGTTTIGHYTTDGAYHETVSTSPTIVVGSLEEENIPHHT